MPDEVDGGRKGLGCLPERYVPAGIDGKRFEKVAVMI